LEQVGSLEEWVLRGGGLRFTQLLDALPEAITIRTADNEIVFANRAALAQFEVDSVEQLRERTTESTLGDYALYDERGEPLAVDELPSPRTVHRESPGPLLVRAVSLRTRDARWWRLESLPLLDVNDELIGATTVIEDLTAVKTAEIRTRVLAESGRMLAASLDYEQTLRNVADVAVPAVADWCAVDLIDHELQRERLVFAPTDGSGSLPLATTLRWFEGDRVSPESDTAKVLGSGESILYERVTNAQLARWATDGAALTRLRELDLCSVLIVPLRVPARTIGVMVFITTESRLTREDQELGEQLGRRAAVAVDNARLHARLTTVAETLERSLLPEPLPEIPGWESASLYRPVASELRIDIGGDFLELFREGESGFAIVGDVEGQGVTAATMTTLMRYGARFAARFEPEPAAILEHLDEVLRHHRRDATCTALCARIELDRLVVGSAGHPPALIASRSGEVREVPGPGPLLGAFADADWGQEEVPVSPGEIVLFYTDGVTDTLGGRGRFGRDRLRALLAEYAHESPAALLGHLERALRQHGDGGEDDLAALALARR
jgi:serine phosphatase RsbU (regulator of sigma subunit)